MRGTPTSCSLWLLSCQLDHPELVHLDISLALGGQQAGSGTSCLFARLVSEAKFSPELRALLSVLENQPWALHKLPGTSARHVSTTGRKNVLPRVAAGLLMAMPARVHRSPHWPRALAKHCLVPTWGTGCLLSQVSAYTSTSPENTLSPSPILPSPRP